MPSGGARVRAGDGGKERADQAVAQRRARRQHPIGRQQTVVARNDQDARVEQPGDLRGREPGIAPCRQSLAPSIRITSRWLGASRASQHALAGEVPPLDGAGGGQRAVEPDRRQVAGAQIEAE